MTHGINAQTQTGALCYVVSQQGTCPLPYRQRWLQPMKPISYLPLALSVTLCDISAQRPAIVARLITIRKIWEPHST
ncbi:hypothetical protein VN97_g5081 [Penicillium thymicola]|uniref:Uncharacterized protein n=1 Tax=Penicillium thymicola TaxID=293382 RepID=A0AAI9X910_PENTH|nr:hypothetical protein VN97_g5081 [Penicillium thymicola]